MSNPSHVETIFFAALQLRSEAERNDYLQGACGHDDELLAQVERLLSAYPRVGSFLERPVAERAVAGAVESSTVDDVERQRAAEGPGSLIGPYKLLEQIGEGGFGIVFMAEQQQPLRRKVAVKVLKPGMDSRAVIARFEAERQALALMDHENIARVYDGGTTASGRPYFVMELVRGAPITQHCDEQQLTACERLALFVSVCRAVQHAHTKGVIHRDLKPSNVLVTMHDAVPVVKVIDFGIAKALGQQLTEKTLFTGFAQMVGTPLYMSPEQAEMSGLDVDTRADIYSLGVLLYELLTGTTPFDELRLREAGYDEMRRIIREEEPPKPSARIHTLGAAATTVSARRKSDPRRLCQLVHGELDWIVMKALEKDRQRRYETAGAMAADVENYRLGAVVSACPPSLAYRARKFTRRNRAALATAAGVLLTSGALAGSAGWVVRDQAAREAALDAETERAIEEAAAFINTSAWPEAAAAVGRAERILSAAGREKLPPRLAELHREAAMALRLEEIYSQAAGDEFFTGRDQDAEYAQAFRDYGIDVNALPLEEAAKSIRDSAIRSELARAMDCWSGMRRRTPGRQESEWKELIRIAKAADPDPWRNQLRGALEHNDRTTLRRLAVSNGVEDLPATTLQLLGWTLGEIGDAEQAVRFLRRVQARYPSDLWFNELLAHHCQNSLHLHSEAIRYYAAARAARPRNAHLAFELGYALSSNCEFDQAIIAFTEAIRLAPRFFKAYRFRSNAYLSAGDGDQALVDSMQLTELAPDSAQAWMQRAHTYNRLGRCQEALADAEQAVSLDSRSALAWLERGRARAGLKKWEDALSDYSHAVKLDPRSSQAWNELAWFLATADQSAIRDPARAVDAARRSVALHAGEGDCWNTLGIAQYRAGDFPAAVKAIEKAIELHRGGDGFDLVALAMCHWRLGHPELARYCYEGAVDWMRWNISNREEMLRFAGEAAALMGVEPPEAAVLPFEALRRLGLNPFRPAGTAPQPQLTPDAIRRGVHLRAQPAETNDPQVQRVDEKRSICD